jgi:hypothetical protein
VGVKTTKKEDRLTQQQRDRQALEADYARALSRAQERGVAVVAEGDGVDGVRYWFVPSVTSGPDADWHRVWIAHRQLQCSCGGGQHGQICLHKAVVRAQIAAEAQAVQRAEERQHAARPTGRVVANEPRRGRATRCYACDLDFDPGAEVVLLRGQAYHLWCQPSGDTAPATN